MALATGVLILNVACQAPTPGEDAGKSTQRATTATPAEDAGKAMQGVDRARYLLDIYYGDRKLLDEAQRILETEMARAPANADAYVQAARVAMNLGYVMGDTYRPGTLGPASELLAKAVALNPKNADAHLLRSEVYDGQGDYEKQMRAMQDVWAIDSSSSWALYDFGKYCTNVRNSCDHLYYSQVVKLGPGTSPRQQRMYVMALHSLAAFRPGPGDPTLDDLANTAMQAKYATDAWTPGNFAMEFFFHGRYEDAASYARSALKIMSYGGARLTLAASLYGRAAQLFDENNAAEASKYALEAKAMGFAPPSILSYFGRNGGEAGQKLMPTLVTVVK